MKRFLFVVTCLLAMWAANASITITVRNSEIDSGTYLYVWDDDLNVLNGAWPGTQMTTNDDGFLSATFYTDRINIIFNNGKSGMGNQTEDITGIEESRCYDLLSASVYQQIDCSRLQDEDIYVVAGVAPLLDYAWNIAASANEMTVVDGVATLTKSNRTLAAGVYEYKVVKNHEEWIPDGENCKITIEQDGIYDITFTYVLDSEQPTAVATLIQAVEVGDKYVIAGDQHLLGTDWNAMDENNLMTVTDGVATLVKTDVVLQAGTYQFKVVKNGTEWIPEGEDNASTVTVPAFNWRCDVTFTYVLGSERATGEIDFKERLEGPSSYVVVGSYMLLGSDWNKDDSSNSMTIDGTTATLTKTSVLLQAGTYEYKVVENGDTWYPSGENEQLTIETAGKYDVVFTINLLSYDVSATATLQQAQEVADVYVVCGMAELLGGDAWRFAEENIMTVADGVATLTKTNINLQAGTYEFKVVKNYKTWLPEGTDNNVELAIPANGEYTVEFKYVIGEDAPTATATASIPTMLNTVLIDYEQPMYNVLGEQVQPSYQGIVIQNGKKFLLKP